MNIEELKSLDTDKIIFISTCNSTDDKPIQLYYFYYKKYLLKIFVKDFLTLCLFEFNGKGDDSDVNLGFINCDNYLEKYLSQITSDINIFDYADLYSKFKMTSRLKKIEKLLIFDL